MKKIIIVGLALVLSGCWVKQRSPHPHAHWNPSNKAEKHCYHEGYKPDTAEFQICVEKYHTRLKHKRHQEQVFRGAQMRREKLREEKLMRQKARQERLMKKKALQQERMRKSS